MNGITNSSTYESKTSKNSQSNSWLTRLLFNMLENIAHGHLTVQEGDKVRTFGNDMSLRAHVTINDRRA